MNILSKIGSSVSINGVVIAGAGVQTLTDDEAKAVTSHHVFHKLVATGAISDPDAEPKDEQGLVDESALKGESENGEQK